MVYYESTSVVGCLFVFQSRRNLCEEALLKIKGVISFTFQMAVQRCVVRIRSDLKAEVSAQYPSRSSHYCMVSH